MCAHTQLPADIASLSLIRALHSLTESEVVSLSLGLRDLPGAWSVEQHEGYDGDLLVLLVQDWAADEALSFALHRSAAGLHLSAQHGDEHIGLGTFAALHEVMGVIRARVLAETAGQTAPGAA